MDIRAIKTTMGEDVVTEVIETQRDYYVVRFPIVIVETGDPSVGNFITKWLKFNDSDQDVKMYTRCIAGEAPALEASAKQYIEMTGNFRKQKAAVARAAEIEGDIEGHEIGEPTEEDYKNLLEIINLGPNGKVH